MSSSSRIHIGETFNIIGSGFGSIQGSSTITIGGIAPTVLIWNETLIKVIMPEIPISKNQYVEILINVGDGTAANNSLWVLLGGILRFVNPDNWDDIILDLDNGGDESGQEIWQQQGTSLPPPSTETIFTSPVDIDGEELIHSRLTNKEITLNLLLSGSSKNNLDIVVNNLLLELYKKTGCLEYRPEKSSKSIFYTYYTVLEQPDFSDYFLHKDRDEHYSYNTVVKLSCKPWAEAQTEYIIASTNLLTNGSFEKSLDEWSSTAIGLGSPGVSIDSTRKMLGGTKSCEFITTDVNSLVSIINNDFIPIDSNKSHNIQIFGWSQGGTGKITAILYCYDIDGVATSPSGVTVLVDANPAGAFWEDLVTLYGYPVIYPEGSTNACRWPVNTAKIKLYIQQTNAIAQVSIDGILLTESEFISDNLLEASIGIVVPKGEVKGNIPALMDIYIGNAHNTGRWNLQNTGIYDNLYGIDYISASIAVAVGAAGKILFNNGSEWLLQNSGTALSLYSIHNLDSTHFWSVGENGIILFSNNGFNWVSQTFPISPELFSIGNMEAWISDSLMSYWDFNGFFGSTLDNDTDKKSGTYCARMEFPYSVGDLAYDGGWESWSMQSDGPIWNLWSRSYPMGTSYVWNFWADTDHPNDGTYCLKTQSDNITEKIGYCSAISFPINPSADYIFSFSSFQDSDTERIKVKAYIAFYNYLGQHVGSCVLHNAYTAYSNNYTYTHYTCDMPKEKIPSSAIWGSIYFEFTTGGGGTTIWLDSVHLVVGNSSRSYGTLGTKVANLLAIDIRKSYEISFWVKGYNTTTTYSASVDFWDSTKTIYKGSHTICASTHTSTSYIDKAHVIIPSDYPAGTAYIGVTLTAVDGTTWGGRWVNFDDVSIKSLPLDLKSVCSIANNNVLAVGECGCIIKYDGSIWTMKTSGVTFNLNSITVVDSTHIIVVGDNGTILTSADGSTWTLRSSGTTVNLNGVTSLSSGKVWAVGDNGIILYSSDNGLNWTSQLSPVLDHDFYSVYVYDASNAWICGEKGILVTFDGSKWTIEGSGINYNLNSISAYDATHIMAVGDSGNAIVGLNSSIALLLTDLSLGQSKHFSKNFNPVLDAIGATLTPPAADCYRRRSRFRSMSAGETEEFLYNVYDHKGVYLISIGGGINNAVNYDQIVPTLSLKDAANVAITPTVTPTVPASLDLSVASGYTTIGYFREVVMLASKFAEIDIPSSFISSLATQANINQSIIITAPSGMGGGDRLNIDCLTIIPTDESFILLNNWRTGASGAQQTFMIISSTDNMILSSITDSIESAVAFNSNYVQGSPQFKANPLGMNLTLIASYKNGTTTTTDYQLSPRLNIVLKYKPRYLLSGI